MARTYWTIYTLESGDIWTVDSAGLPKPNDDFVLETVSTQTKQKLADGSNAFVTPEVVSERLPLLFKWYMDDLTIKDQIETYIENQESLKIVTGVGGMEFIGRFLSVRSTWLLGQDPNEFDIEATFEVMEVISIAQGGTAVTVDELAEFFVFGETPSPAPNGVQTVFTVSNPYVAGKLEVFRAGQRIYEGVDYTETTSTTFTMTVAPEAAETIRVNYLKDI